MRKMDRRTFLRLIAGLATTAAVAAAGVGCAPGASFLVPIATPTQSTGAGAAVPKGPTGELTIGLSTGVDTLDVHLTRGGSTPAIMAHVMDGLRRRVSSGAWVPHLLKSWENVDDVTWIFHLQEGVEFTNGEKFNAAVLAYNFKRFADPATGTMQGGTQFTRYFKSCEVVDEYTVRWTTTSPVAPLLEFIPRPFLMMSPKAISELGKQTANQAVGSGPFKVVEYAPGERLVLEANEKYWMGAPKIAKVTIRTIPETATRLVELKTGRVDIIDQVPAENIPELEQAGGIKMVRVPSELTAYIQLNCAREPFNSVKVRQALNYAINRDAIVKGVMLGAGVPQVGYLSPAHEGYDPNLKPYAYDPDKARQLLADAGYPKGFKFTLSGPSGRYYKDKEILQAVASQLEAIGLTVTLNIVEWNTYVNQFTQTPRPFEAAMMGYGNSGGALYVMNSNVYSKANAYGYYGYVNPAFDKLYEEAMITFDPKQRDLKVRQLRQILYDDAPFIFVAGQQIVYAVRSNVQDFNPWPDGDFWLREGQGVYKTTGA